MIIAKCIGELETESNKGAKVDADEFMSRDTGPEFAV